MEFFYTLLRIFLFKGTAHNPRDARIERKRARKRTN